MVMWTQADEPYNYPRYTNSLEKYNRKYTESLETRSKIMMPNIKKVIRHNMNLNWIILY
jgi:hypothetical protein